MIEVRNLSKVYRMGDHEVRALDDVSLTISQGDFVAIMGPSGSGKSTLMHVLGLLDSVDYGEYFIDGVSTSQKSEDELAELRRRKVGFIFQQFHLLPRVSAAENTSLPLLYSEGHWNQERALEELNRVGLGSRSHHRPNELSGGQQQRVAIARALINRPKILFADEPTGNLDSKSEKEVMGILKSLNQAGITIVLVTHEDEIGQQANRVIRMRDGKIQSDERLKEISNSLKSSGEAQENDLRTYKKPSLSFFQQLGMAVRNLESNKLRTFLSILGILIGVAAVVAMLAIGSGAQQAVKAQLSSLGSNMLVLRAGSMRGIGGAMMESGSVARLDLGDVKAIKQSMPLVKSTAGNLNGRGQVVFKNKNWTSSIQGVSETYADARAAQPIAGRFFTEQEIASRARVAVLGMTLVKELFQYENPIGEMIKINRVIFQVIGVLPEKGSSGFQDQDDRILVPVTTAMYRLFGKNHLDFIDIEVHRAEDTQTVLTDVEEFMISRKKVAASQTEGAFQVRNMADIQEAVSSSTRIMTLLLSVIAAISLLVGGIGIMNIMLVSVTERTREIGLRKAIGAKRKDILNQFLMESVVISLVGGILGLVFAAITTFLISRLAGWASSISLWSVILAVGFSSFIGIIFGFYPAKRASNLEAISALRFE